MLFLQLLLFIFLGKLGGRLGGLLTDLDRANMAYEKADFDSDGGVQGKTLAFSETQTKSKENAVKRGQDFKYSNSL